MFPVNREVKQGQVNNLNSLQIINVEIQDKVEIETEVLGFFTALLNGHHRSVPGVAEPEDTGKIFVPDPALYPLFLEELDQIQDTDKDALKSLLILEDLKAALEFMLLSFRELSSGSCGGESWKCWPFMRSINLLRQGVLEWWL